MRGFLLLLLVSASFGAGAQDLARRHALISTAYKAERYAEVAQLIDLQLREAAGTPWEDSTHLYLYKYGRAVRKLKGADASVAAAERIYALVQQRGRPEQEVEALFDLSWTYYDAGRMKECLRVDSTAVVVAERGPGISPTNRGRACQYVAFDHAMLGDHRSSLKYALKALAIYDKADSIPPTQWSESYNAAGTAYLHMGLIRDAERYLKKGLKVLGEDTSEATLSRKANTYGNLGVLWQGAGDYVRSKGYYYQGLRLLDQLVANATDPFTRDEAIVNRSRSYLNLATVFHQYGDDGRARELLEMAWNDRSQVLEADDPQLLAVQERMADIEFSAGDLEKAEELTRNYLIACERKYGRTSDEYIRTCTKLGGIALRQGQAAQADSLFGVSIAVSRSINGKSTNMLLATTLQHRARMYEEQGQYTQALNDLQQAKVILMNVNGPEHYRVAECEVRLAEVTYEKGDPEVSLGHARAAIGMLQDRVKALQATRAPQTFNNPHILPDAIYWKVRAEQKLAGNGEGKTAWSKDLDLAILALARNKAAVRDEASRLLLIGAQKQLFELALDLAYEGYVRTGSDTDLERFINISEANRSILLKERLNNFAGMQFAGVPDTVIAREQELFTALDLDSEDRAAATDMDKREQAYADFLADLERNYPVYFNLRYGEPRINLTDIREHLLTPDRQLLAYTRSGPSLYAWVAGLDGDTIIRLDNAGIYDAMKAMSSAIMARETALYTSASFKLYQLAVAPFQPLLTSSELLIIPDGALHDLNFETLLTKPDSRNFERNLLIQQYTIAYLLSTTTALQFSNLARRHSNGILALAPGFNDQLKQDYIAGLKDPSTLDEDYLHFVRQPFAERTARDLGRMLSANVMVGKAANEKAFRENAARFGILHMGTHAELNANSPMYSRLVLSKNGSELEPDDDGYLHAYEIYELDLRAQLAVLTACATGSGKKEAGEGVRSLGYGFAYAGCPSLVVSLWNIDEKVSAELIALFYANLAEGMPKHKALREAKLSYLAHAPQELALPYYWAGLVLVGDVEPVVLSTKRSHPWILAGTVLLLIMGWLLWKRMRMHS
ncbi:MAG: CHAT domain-containing protein [Flavobacteriales bacterium]